MRKIKAFDWKTVLLLIFIIFSVFYFGSTMGFANYFSTIMYTAHHLLINTVFFILGITVISGAFGSFLAEFGILALLNGLPKTTVKLQLERQNKSTIVEIVREKVEINRKRNYSTNSVSLFKRC